VFDFPTADTDKECRRRARLVWTVGRENEGRSDGRLSLTACVREGNALLRLVGTVDANGGACYSPELRAPLK